MRWRHSLVVVLATALLTWGAGCKSVLSRRRGTESIEALAARGGLLRSSTSSASDPDPMIQQAAYTVPRIGKDCRH